MRKIKIFLICISIFICFISCNTVNNKSSELSPRKPQVVKIFTYYTNNTLNSFKNSIKKFNDTVGKEKGVIVEVMECTDLDQTQEKLVDLAKKSASNHDMFPDAFITYKSELGPILELKEIVDYREYFTKDELLKYEEKLIKDGKYGYEDKFYAFPIGISTDISYVNKTHLEKYMDILDFGYADIATYEGLSEVAKKYYEYTDRNTSILHDGKSIYGADAMYQQAIKIFESMNGSLTKKENGREILNISKQSAKKVWDLIYVPIIKGYYSKSNKYIYEDFKLDDVLIATASSSSSTYFPNIVFENDEAMYIDVVTIASPQLKNGKKLTIKQGGDIFLTRSSRIKEKAVVEFIKWFTSKEHNLEFTLSTTYLPVIKDYTHDDIVATSKAIGSTPLQIDTIKTARAQLLNIKTYDSANKKSFSVIRKIMSDVFDDGAYSLRYKILESSKNSNSYDELIKEYTSEEAFKKWYTNLLTRINEKL